MRVKFGTWENDAMAAHRYPAHYEKELNRLVIGAPEPIPLIRTLVRHLSEPLRLLYVLVERGQPGRYSSPPLSSAEVLTFLDQFGAFLAEDGRHHLWVASAQGQLVYDRHDLIYAYGPGWEDQLVAQGWIEGPVRMPFPHLHGYHADFDEDMQALLTYLPWKVSPLVEGQDD